MIRKNPLPTAGQALQPQEPRVTLSQQLSASLRHLKPRITLLPEPYACCVLFFTVAADGAQAGVFFVRRSTLEAAWREGTTRVRQWAWMRQLTAVELRIDWPDEIMVIGNRIPTLHPWGAASAWALADDGLEHAELMPPTALASASHAAAGAQGPQRAATLPWPDLAEVNLLLRLHGLHVDRNGLQTELPAAPAPQRGTAAYARHARRPGWLQPERRLHGVDCAPECISRAWQLAQQSAADPALTDAAMAQVMERAFACLEHNIAGLTSRCDRTYLEQAMGMLLLMRCMAARGADGALLRLAGPIERLIGQLETLGTAQAPSREM